MRLLGIITTSRVVVMVIVIVTTVIDGHNNNRTRKKFYKSTTVREMCIMTKYLKKSYLESIYIRNKNISFLGNLYKNIYKNVFVRLKNKTIKHHTTLYLIYSYLY